MIYLNCYVETFDELVRLEIRGEGKPCYNVDIWENDVLRDDISTLTDLVDVYSEFYYKTKEDFKKDRKKKFFDYFSD